MATFTIPTTVVIGLTRIATLPEESFNQIQTALESIPLRIRQHRAFDDSEFKLEVVSEDEAKAIKDALLPLYASLAVGKVSASEYVDDITDSLKEAGHEGLDWLNSEEVVIKFKGRLVRLLSIESLQLIAKAHDVLLEHEQTFSTARVLSDIRPVFRQKVEEPPVAAVIVHMLNIVYVKANERQEIVLALDTKDIPYLIEVLERAKTKTETLKAVINSTGMTYLDVV